jgi:hypothetical protein
VAVTPPVLPADHLADGELLEGTAIALGVTLPRGIKIDETFGTTVYASGSVRLHPFVEYLRAHLKDGELREGEASATFKDVTPAGKDGPRLTIHLGRVRDYIQVDMHDETPPVLPPLPDDAARWKRVGLTPSGRIMDPHHLD